MKLEFSRQIFEKMFKYELSTKSVNWKPSCCIRTDMKLIVSFRNFANAPNKEQIHKRCDSLIFYSPTIILIHTWLHEFYQTETIFYLATCTALHSDVIAWRSTRALVQCEVNITFIFVVFKMLETFPSCSLTRRNTNLRATVGRVFKYQWRQCESLVCAIWYHCAK